MSREENKKVIEDFFKNNKDESYSSNAIVSEFVTTMDRATVYRQLSKLETEGVIVKNFNNSKDTYEYRYSNDCKGHMHLICEKCGKVIHLECKSSDEFINHLLREHGFSVDKCHSTIYGICDECKGKNNYGTN